MSDDYRDDLIDFIDNKPCWFDVKRDEDYGLNLLKHYDRIKALADLVVVKKRVECDCDNGTVKIRGADNVLLTVKCMGCHGTRYVDEVKPGKLLEILEIAMGKMCGSCSRVADSKGNHPCDVCEHIEWNKTIAEARKHGGIR